MQVLHTFFRGGAWDDFIITNLSAQAFLYFATIKL